MTLRLCSINENTRQKCKAANKLLKNFVLNSSKSMICIYAKNTNSVVLRPTRWIQLSVDMNWIIGWVVKCSFQLVGIEWQQQVICSNDWVCNYLCGFKQNVTFIWADKYVNPWNLLRFSVLLPSSRPLCVPYFLFLRNAERNSNHCYSQCKNKKLLQLHPPAKYQIHKTNKGKLFSFLCLLHVHMISLPSPDNEWCELCNRWD